MARTWKRRYGFKTGAWRDQPGPADRSDTARANLLADRSIAVRLSTKVQAGVPRTQKGRWSVDKEIRDMVLQQPALLRAKRTHQLFEEAIRKRDAKA